jgi:deoxyribodipyrimidine photo-lyase
MASAPVIMWFRHDLRLDDNPALVAAVATGAPLVALYVLDDVTPGPRKFGGAARWWLDGSLKSLSRDIERLGGRLIVKVGASEAVLDDVVAQTGASAVFCSRSYELWSRRLEDRLHVACAKRGVALKRYPGTLLVEPDAITTKTGGPFKVYTPFWRALVAKGEPRRPVPAPKKIVPFAGALDGVSIESLGLLPTKPDWAGGMREAWSPGEQGARKRLETFLATAVRDYAELRNRPDLPATSQLSPYLRFGEISPAACWHAARAAASDGPGLETFLKELAWREFSYHLLFHFPDLADAPFRPEFAKFPWAPQSDALQAWQRGRTGYPIVDAGMRQLWATGWMHNRVRMIVGSFLVKHLLIPWQEGEAWFWDTLVDADPASNAASWQWVAGSGADAAPYFRIFAPVKQGQTFDPDGTYVRRWVPELAKLPAPALHAPWEAGPAELAAAGVTLGRDYPHPIVDHGKARLRALAAYETMRSATG